MPITTLKYSEKMEKAITALSQKYKKSRAEIFRKAIALLDVATEIEEKGQYLAAVDQDEKVIYPIALD